MIQLCLRLTPEEWDDLLKYAAQRRLNTEEAGRLLVTRQPLPEPEAKRKR